MSDQPVRDTNDMMRRRNLRVTEQLLAELEAKRWDSALTRRILATPSAFPRLLRACFLAQEGEYASARADVREARSYGRGNPVVELVAGMILYATRDYQEAITQLEHAASLSSNAAHRARQQIIGFAGNLGWEHDLRRALEAAIAAEPADPSWHAQAVRLFVRGRHFDKALEHAKRALELAPGSARMWMELAGIHAHLDQREPAIAAVRRALELGPKDGQQELGYVVEGARVCIEAGDFELAAAQLERARALAPDDPAHVVGLAELRTWAGDREGARALIEQARALDPSLAAVARLDGALHMMAGEHEAAIASLQRALELDERDYQAHVWLSEVYLRTARYDEAHAQLHHGTMNAGGFLFVAWLLRFLIVAAEAAANGRPEAKVPPYRTEEFSAALRELAPALAKTCLETRALDDTVAAVEAAVVALRGNRSIYATHVVDGALTRIHARTGCRHESRWALQLLRVATGEECLAYFDEIIAKYPGSSLPHCHRGELKLWLGDYAGAKADLERAIAIVRGTRWAYMGLSTLGLIEGDYEAALAINAEGVAIMNDTEGPAIHVYRGEAKRKLGRIDEAIEELEQALRWHPARASATINLALAYHAAGRSEDFEALWLRLRDEQASGLLSDAALELGLTIFGDRSDPEAELDVEARTGLLEHALKMMGGNRSSGLLSYWTAAGKLRFVQLWPHEGHDPHTRDHEQLERAKRMLLKALARYRGPRPPSGASR